MHKQPALPYAKNALAPYISESTMDYHYNKHLKAYFDKLNSLTAGTQYADMSLEAIIQQSEGAIFNNAAQAWNHIFYWDSLSPKIDQTPTGELLNAIQRDFGSVDTFKNQFTQAALNTFGSGWAWLVRAENGKLQIMSTSNAHTPIETPGLTPLLTCDVWEHAYYLDTQNNRASYLDHFWKVCNWEHAHQVLIG
jgi:Fe-Mn family superoxide dismutase